MYRFDYGDNRIKRDAVIGFLLGVAVAFVLQEFVFGAPAYAVFTTLIVVAVGGAWYHWRKIL